MELSDAEAFDELAIRYLSGETTSTEREHLVALLKQPSKHERFEELRQVWDISKSENRPKFDIGAAQIRLGKALAADRRADVPKIVAPEATSAGSAKAIRRPWHWVTAAALASVIALIVWQGREWSAGRQLDTLVERVSGVGERAVLTLRDGTRITLNAGSRLRYPDEFDRYSRVVSLEGEAYFEVAHDPTRPFVVETSRVRTTVLGTKFNVTAFTDEPQTQVALVEGRVQVIGTGPNGETKPELLAAGQAYFFDGETGKGNVAKFDAEAATGWLDNRLVFNGESVATVARKLERRFGIDVDASDPRLAAERVSAKFRDESIEEILQLLELTGVIEFQIQRVGGRVERVTLAATATSSPARP